MDDTAVPLNTSVHQNGRRTMALRHYLRRHVVNETALYVHIILLIKFTCAYYEHISTKKLTKFTCNVTLHTLMCIPMNTHSHIHAHNWSRAQMTFCDVMSLHPLSVTTLSLCMPVYTSLHNSCLHIQIISNLCSYIYLQVSINMVCQMDTIIVFTIPSGIHSCTLHTPVKSQ